MPSSTNQTSPLPNPIALVFNGDAYEIFLGRYGNGVTIEKIKRFNNNKNVQPEELHFYDLDRSCRRAAIRAVNKAIKKTIRITPKLIQT